MQRTLFYFAWVADIIGKDSESRDIDDKTTIGETLDILSAVGGGHAAAFADRNRLRYALDGEMADADSKIGKAVEIAIFPPVTGG